MQGQTPGAGTYVQYSGLKRSMTTHLCGLESSATCYATQLFSPQNKPHLFLSSYSFLVPVSGVVCLFGEIFGRSH
jgi:hypothetical protein